MFLQQLTQVTMQENQYVVNCLVQKEMECFKNECQAAVLRGKTYCHRNVDIDEICERDGCQELVLRKFQERMSELGIPEGASGAKMNGMSRWYLTLSAEWQAEAMPSCVEEKPIPEGTCIACPVCLEHRPAVALIPCGHVICRDCQRCQQVLQCPMCRQQITSATRGLFMD